MIVIIKRNKETITIEDESEQSSEEQLMEAAIDKIMEYYDHKIDILVNNKKYNVQIQLNYEREIS